MVEQTRWFPDPHDESVPHQKRRWEPVRGSWRDVGQPRQVAVAFSLRGLRVRAALIDVLLVALPVALGLLVEITSGRPGLVVGLLVAVAAWWVDRCAAQGATGRSLGKRALRLRLVDEHTLAPLGVPTCTVRELARIADAGLRLVLLASWLWPASATSRRPLADRVRATLVLLDARR